MTPLQELRDEVGRVGRLIDAGQRGVPIGGELLIAFGTILALLVSFGAFEALRYFPMGWLPSPLACASAFLAFVVVVVPRRDHWLRGGITAMVLAGLVGEGVWQAGLQFWATLRDSDPAAASLLGFAYFAVPVALIGLAAGIALWRLRSSAAAASPANRAVLGTWLALAAAMVVASAASALTGLKTGNWFALNLLPTVFWILWGAGWAASAAATGSRWMLAVTAGAWALALWEAASFDIYFPSVAGFVLFAILPGLQLTREARRTHEA